MRKNKRKHTTKLSKSEHARKVHPGYKEVPGMKVLTPEILLTGIFILALLIRLLYINQITSTPIFHGLVVDAEKYDHFALKILAGDFTRKEFIYLNPLYPFFLALIYLIGGHSHILVVLTQALIDSLSCMFIYYIVVKLFNKVVGIMAAVTYACYGLAIFYTGTILAPTLVIFLSLSFIASLLAAQEEKKSFTFFIPGILFGLVVSARPNVILFLFFLPLWFFTVLKNKLGVSKTIQRFLLFLFGFFLIMLIIIIRNYSIEKRFSPFSVQGGINFYIGNNPKATGTFMTPHGISSSPIDQVKTSINYAGKESGKSLTPYQASRYWLFKGLKFIKNDPLDAFTLYMTKCAFFFRKEELPLNIDYTLSRSFAPLLQLPLISFGIIAPFALLGIILSFKRSVDIWLLLLFIVSYTLSVTIFFVTARYRVPVVPFLIIFSSYALYCMVEMVRTKDKRGIMIFGAVLALLFTGINKDFSYFKIGSPSKHYNNLGLVYHKEGRLDEAVAALKKALLIDPHCFESHYNLGNVYLEKGVFNEAIDKYKRALEINPDYAEAHNNLGMAYGKKGMLDKAISEFSKALAIKPDYAEAYYNRGTAYGKKGLLDRAILDIKKALSINPDYAEAHYNLGLAYIRKGMNKKAASEFKKGIALNPDLAEAYKKLSLGTELNGTKQGK